MTNILSGDLAAAGAARRGALEGKQFTRAQGGWVSLSADAMALATQRRKVSFPTEIRADLIERDGKQFHRVQGYATVFDKQYDMYDMFGPYQESVAAGAADVTLAADPDVVFLVNHTGLAMARTINGSLELSADKTGMRDVAYLNPERADVRDLVLGIEDGTITEQSFAFRIDEGWWNDDFTEFKIVQYDINRGDVSAVNYGANPFTDIAARQRHLLGELRHLDGGLARAAATALGVDVFERMNRREQADLEERQATIRASRGVVDEAKGRSLTHVLALLEG